MTLEMRTDMYPVLIDVLGIRHRFHIWAYRGGYSDSTTQMRESTWPRAGIANVLS